MELKAAVITIVGMVLSATPTLSLTSGAPASTCSSMTPGHGSQQTAASPYSIVVDTTKFIAGYTITVNVSGPNFMGILMQVRKPGADTAYGTWSSLPDNTRLLMCTNAADSVTHANTNAKQNAVFTWTAPEGVTDDLEVIATVAQAKSMWWKGVKSDTLTYDASLITTTTTATTTITTATTATTTPTATTTITTATTATTTTAPSMSTCIGLSALSIFLAIFVALLAPRFY